MDQSGAHLMAIMMLEVIVTSTMAKRRSTHAYTHTHTHSHSLTLSLSHTHMLSGTRPAADVCLGGGCGDG